MRITTQAMDAFIVPIGYIVGGNDRLFESPVDRMFATDLIYLGHIAKPMLDRNRRFGRMPKMTFPGLFAVRTKNHRHVVVIAQRTTAIPLPIWMKPPVQLAT